MLSAIASNVVSCVYSVLPGELLPRGYAGSISRAWCGRVCCVGTGAAGGGALRFELSRDSLALLLKEVDTISECISRQA